MDDNNFVDVNLSNCEANISIGDRKLFHLKSTNQNADSNEYSGFVQSEEDTVFLKFLASSGVKLIFLGKTFSEGQHEELVYRDTATWIPCQDNRGRKYGYKCSVCKAKIRNKDSDRHLFCYNCGRRMEK